MKRIARTSALVSAAALASLAVLAGVQSGSADQERSHDTDLQTALAAGNTLDVRNIAGFINVTQANGGTATIHAHVTARSGDPATVAIKLVHDHDRVFVCAQYPGTTCGADGIHSNHDGNDVDHDDFVVDFTIAIPRGVKLDANTVDGNVTAHALDAAVRAGSVQGNITILTSDSADAKTVSGSIDATLGRIGKDDDLSFQSVNGSIHLTLPAHADATLEARTVNGPISGDSGVPLNVTKGQYVGNSGDAKFGNGAAHVALKTVNGPIRVSRS